MQSLPGELLTYDPMCARRHTHTRTSVKLRISASSVRSRVFGGSEGWEFLCLAHRCLLKTQPILLYLLYSSLDILSFSSLHFLSTCFPWSSVQVALCFMFPVSSRTSPCSSVSQRPVPTQNHISHTIFSTHSLQLPTSPSKCLSGCPPFDCLLPPHMHTM